MSDVKVNGTYSVALQVRVDALSADKTQLLVKPVEEFGGKAEHFWVSKERLVNSTLTMYLSLIDVLQHFGLMDRDGHILTCGYTDENPTCRCVEFGVTVHEAVTQPWK